MDKIKEVKEILHDRCVSCGAIANLPTLQNDWKADKDAHQICQLIEPKADESLLIIKGTEHPEERIPFCQPKPDESRLLTPEVIDSIRFNKPPSDKSPRLPSYVSVLLVRQRDLTVSIKDAECQQEIQNIVAELDDVFKLAPHDDVYLRLLVSDVFEKWQVLKQEGV